MKIEGKRIITFSIHKKENYAIQFTDTENKTDNGYKTVELEIVPNNIGRISSLFTNDKYAFVGFGNKYNDNIIANFVIQNKKLLETTTSGFITDRIESTLEGVLEKQDKELEKKYKYTTLFNSFDLQRFILSKSQYVGLRQFVMSSTFKFTDEEHDSENIANILDENKNRIEARLEIEKMYDEDLFDGHEGTIGAKLIKSIYARKNNVKQNELRPGRNVKCIDLGKILLPGLKFRTEQMKMFLEDLSKESIQIGDEWMKYVALGRYEVIMNLAGIRMNTQPITLVSDNDGDIYNIDVSSFYPSIAVAYGIKPSQVNESFLETFNDMLKRRMSLKHTNKDISDSMKLMLNGIIGQFMIEDSWLYDPEASFKIRINGALMMLMLMERLYDDFDIKCVTIDGMFVKSKGKGLESKLANIVKEWKDDSKLNAEITKFEYAYMLSNNDYITDSTSKGLFSYHGNNGAKNIPEIIRIAVKNNLLDGTPVESTITECNDIKEYLMSISSQDLLEWNGSVFKDARYYCSNDQKLCKIKEGYASEPTTVPITRYGVTITDTIEDRFPENIDYNYYISESNKIVEKIKVQQLNLFQ